MLNLADVVRHLVPPEAQAPTELPEWLRERLDMMRRWGEANLSGARLEYFCEFLARERYAGLLHECTLRRAKGTKDPWDMNTSEDDARSVFYYEVPWETDDAHDWHKICEGMQFDGRLTQELADRMIEKCQALAIATPERMQRLRNLYTARFKTNAPAHQFRKQGWANTKPDEFKGSFQDR